MDKDKQDIYDIRQPEDSSNVNAPRSQVGVISRTFKHSSIIFRLIIIVFMLALGLFVVYQTRLHRPTYSGTGRVDPQSQPVRLRTDSVLDFDGDLQNQLIMDELNNIVIDPVPNDGTFPLSIYWVKQSAVRLLKAERAFNLEQWEEAIQHYTEVMEIFPEIEGVEAKLGICYIRIDDYATSIDAFNHAVNQTTNSYRIMNNIGVAHMSNNKFEEAEQCFLHVLEIKSDYAPARHNLALLYSRTEMYTESAEQFEKYFAIVDLDIHAKQTYTKVLIELERWDDATKVLEDSIKKMPKAAPLYMALAHVLSHYENKDRAMDHLLHGVNLLDRSTALTMLGSPEFDLLRPREGFKKLMADLTAGIE